MPNGGKEDKHGKSRSGRYGYDESVACQELEAREELFFHLPHHEYADAEHRKDLIRNAVAREKRPRLGEYLADYAERRGYVVRTEEYPGDENDSECYRRVARAPLRPGTFRGLRPIRQTSSSRRAIFRLAER